MKACFEQDRESTKEQLTGLGKRKGAPNGTGKAQRNTLRDWESGKEHLTGPGKHKGTPKGTGKAQRGT